MPIGYGSQFIPPQLLTDEVGKNIINNSSNGSYKWLTGLLTGVGIAVSFIPGIGTLATVGIEATLGTIQTVLDYQNNPDTPWYSTALNYVGAVIPIVGQGVSNLKNASKIGKEIESTIEELSKIKAGIRAGEGIRFDKGIRSVLLESQLETLEVIKPNLGLFGSVNSAAKKYGKEYVKTLAEVNLGKEFTKEFIKEQINDIKQTINSFVNNILKRGITAAGETIDKTEEVIRKNLQAELKISLSLANELVRAMRSGVKYGTKEYASLIHKILKESPNEMRALFVSNKRTFNLVTKGSNVSRAGKVAKKTVKFGQETLEYLTNPSKIIGKVFEKTTGKLKGYLDGKVGELLKKITKSTIKTEQSLIEAFEKTGGTRIKSTWIMGYKLIQEDQFGATLMISFLPSQTGGKKGKNVGGKRPVFVKASHIKIKNFLKATSKGQWYLNNWAKNRGGRTMQSSVLGANVSAILAFIPVEKIQEVIGYASFYKTTFDAYRRGQLSFIGSKNYLASLGKMFVSGMISEAAKFASVGMKDGFAKSLIDGVASSASQGNGLQTQNAFTGAMNSLYGKKTGDKGSGRGKSLADGITSSNSGFKSLASIK